MTVLAIMQPYFLPYIGYWQLLSACDRLVIYDDAMYKPRGWINRNRILVNSAPFYITIPLISASQNRRIYEIKISDSRNWRYRIKKTMELSYRKSPYFDECFRVLSQVIDYNTSQLSDYLMNQLVVLSKSLGIKTDITSSRDAYINTDLRGANRIRDICLRENANKYVNLQGGRDLYNADYFSQAGIELAFVESRREVYPQLRTETFIPSLSIADVMLNVGIERTKQMLTAYNLEPGIPLNKSERIR